MSSRCWRALGIIVTTVGIVQLYGCMDVWNIVLVYANILSLLYTWVAYMN